MVTHKHHSFLAVFVYYVNHFFGKLCNFAPLKSLKIFEFF